MFQEDKYRGTIVYNSYMPNILCIFIKKKIIFPSIDPAKHISFFNIYF